MMNTAQPPLSASSIAKMKLMAADRELSQALVKVALTLLLRKISWKAESAFWLQYSKIYIALRILQADSGPHKIIKSSFKSVLFDCLLKLSMLSVDCKLPGRVTDDGHQCHIKGDSKECCSTRKLSFWQGCGVGVPQSLSFGPELDSRPPFWGRLRLRAHTTSWLYIGPLYKGLLRC